MERDSKKEGERGRERETRGDNHLLIAAHALSTCPLHTSKTNTHARADAWFNRISRHPLRSPDAGQGWHDRLVPGRS